jgi:glyoxylate reductase
MSQKIVFTRPVVGDWPSLLRAQGFEVIFPEGPDRPLGRAELLEKIRGAHGIVSMLNDRMDAEAFDAAGPQLAAVANYAVGYNNIDLAAATLRGIAVSNTPDVLTAATADLGWALLMAAARRLGESERHLRAGKFHGWGPMDFLGVDLDGKTLGILGPGRIGTVVAKRSVGWSMRVLYSHPKGKPEFEVATGGKNVPLRTLLAESDFVVSCLPLNDSTKHLLGAAELALLKPTAVLVSIGRGPVIDEAALVSALRQKQFFAAALDVYEFEPRLAEGLSELENAVLIPHIASATNQARHAMAEMAVGNLQAVLRGERPAQLLNSGWQPRKG